jgi:hypothetical protein
LLLALPLGQMPAGGWQELDISGWGSSGTHELTRDKALREETLKDTVLHETTFEKEQLTNRLPGQDYTALKVTCMAGLTRCPMRSRATQHYPDVLRTSQIASSSRAEFENFPVDAFRNAYLTLRDNAPPNANQ